METKRYSKFIYDFGIDHYSGFQGVYFNKILKNIMEIGKLRERGSLKVLDFGCGLKKLKPYITNYVGYDINKRFTEVNEWQKVDFDIVVANAVFMYMTEKELEMFIKKLYRHNPNAELIFGATRMNFITKLIKFITLSIKGYADVKLTYDEQLQILSKYFTILKKRTIFGLSNVYLMRFK